MAASAIPLVTLKGCDKAMPVMGMGTATFASNEHGQPAKAAILEAIKAGYRHFDTAFAYGSEKPLGEAVAEAIRDGLVESRDQLFITTKLWCSFAEPTQIVPACKMSLQNLKMEYVDMYLIHWPVRLTEVVSKVPVREEIVVPLDVKGAWEGMQQCKTAGLAKAIGLSNFPIHLIQQILSFAPIPPALLQVEMNPLWRQEKLREFCGANGIHITAYSPLGANNTTWGDRRILDNHVLSDIAVSAGKTVPQVALRWLYEQGVSILTKSFNHKRMRENIGIFDWSLSDLDSDKIEALPQRKGVHLASILGSHSLVLELDSML